jgi:tetratricopeptide (TPR) repeat protein
VGEAPNGVEVHSRHRGVAAAGLLVVMLVTAAVYAQVAFFEFVEYDDPVYVVDNAQVRRGLSWEGLRWAVATGRASNWHPVTWLSHMVDVELFELEPGYHHLASLGWHLVNVLLLYLVLRSATGDAVPSLAVAALFALHPINVESVAWVAERKNLVSTTFALAALGAWVRWVRGGGVLAYVASCVALAAGLAAKPMLVTLPFVLLLLDWWPLARPPRLALVLEKLPLVALAAASAAVTYLVQRAGGAVGALDVLPLGARAANAIVAYAAYLRKLVWPVDLALLYQHPWSPGGVPPEPIAVAALFLLLTARTAAAFAGRRRGWPLVGWSWFVGTLVPVIGLVQVGEQGMADRYAYWPAIGLYLIFAFGWRDLARSWPRARLPLAVSPALVVTVLAAATWNQAGHWKHSIALFRRGLEISPASPSLHHNLAVSLEKRGRFVEAEEHYRRALAVRPWNALARFGLANALVANGDPEAAIAEYEEVLDFDPGRTDARNNLALTCQSLALSRLRDGRAREALDAFARAAELRPDWSAPLLGRAWILAVSADASLRDPPAAVRLAEQALALDAGREPALYDTLAAAYAAAGEYDRAVRTALEAVRIARQRGDERRAAAIEARLEAYRRREPWVVPGNDGAGS